MFRTSRFRAFALGWIVALLVATYGCGDATHEAPENTGISGDSSAGAGAAGGADDAANGGASAANDAGTSAADDSSYAGNNSADGECRSGQTRCHGQLGFQRCTPDSIWGPAQSCGGYSENGTSSYCAVFDGGDGTPWAACVDPACWWWQNSGLDPAEQRGGVCVAADQLRRCRAGILLRAPETCVGACQRVGQLDGRALGYCDTECRDGDRECLGGALYRECVKGRWSTTAQTCVDGAACQPLATSPHPDIKCGGACEAGSSRCVEDGSGSETCSAAHEWVKASPCLLGRCVQAAAQAQCQTECQPGEHACELDGAAAERTCGEAGLWNTATPCDAGTACRIGLGGALGCVKCVGADVAGGNAWGVADSHCDAGNVASCGADNTYAAAEACPSGQACVELSRGAASLAYCK